MIWNEIDNIKGTYIIDSEMIYSSESEAKNVAEYANVRESYIVCSIVHKCLLVQSENFESAHTSHAFKQLHH